MPSPFPPPITASLYIPPISINLHPMCNCLLFFGNIQMMIIINDITNQPPIDFNNKIMHKPSFLRLVDISFPFHSALFSFLFLSFLKKTPHFTHLQLPFPIPPPPSLFINLVSSSSFLLSKNNNISELHFFGSIFEPLDMHLSCWLPPSIFLIQSLDSPSPLFLFPFYFFLSC